LTGEERQERCEVCSGCELGLLLAERVFDGHEQDAGLSLLVQHHHSLNYKQYLLLAL
jgi:hypothetical protein